MRTLITSDDLNLLSNQELDEYTNDGKRSLRDEELRWELRNETEVPRWVYGLGELPGVGRASF